MKSLLIFSFLLSTTYVFGQWSKKTIETDSSKITIIKNSEYKVFSEAYKLKDLEWSEVHFIKDTMRLNTKGWSKRDHRRIGIWKEFDFEGNLLFTRDYDNAICEVNKSLFPYHNLLEQMKKKADELIIKTYSKEFFKNHVRFDFNCNAYDEDGYVGDWTEPMKRKPTKFVFRYQVKINTSKWYNEMISITLDNNGEYVFNKSYVNNYGFEKVDENNKTFQIDKNKAIAIAKTKGLKTDNLDKIAEFLKWEKLDDNKFYSGKFKYYITEFTNEIKELKPDARSKITYKYNVYSFNPWNGKFIEKKKMKVVKEWEKNSGFTSDLLPDE